MSPSLTHKCYLCQTYHVDLQDDAGVNVTPSRPSDHASARCAGLNWQRATWGLVRAGERSSQAFPDLYPMWLPRKGRSQRSRLRRRLASVAFRAGVARWPSSHFTSVRSTPYIHRVVCSPFFTAGSSRSPERFSVLDVLRAGRSAMKANAQSVIVAASFDYSFSLTAIPLHDGAVVQKMHPGISDSSRS